MSGLKVDAIRIRDHVQRLGERYPPIDLASADYSLNNGAYPQGADANIDTTTTTTTTGEVPPATPDLGPVPVRVRILGAVAHLPFVHEVIRLLYYLTGAATEKAAMIAYQSMSDGLKEMGETAVQRTIVDAIKVQEPGHFAFYRLSALEMVQAGALASWQLYLARVLRSRRFSLVGAKTEEQRTDYGGVIVNLGLDAEIERSVRDIVRVETQLLWAHRNGLNVPSYALKAFREAADQYRGRTQLQAA